jgi:secreted trypsin-like serine protease
MARLSVFFAIILASVIKLSYQQSPQCGVVLEDGVVGRILGGEDAEKRTWPWQVSLQKDGRHWCGGVLIDANHVLTVAHRVQEARDPSRYKVVLALHDTFKLTKATIVNVQSITVHPNFEGMKNNIAILKLSSPVAFQSKINAVCLPESEAGSEAECFVTGWGERQNNQDLSAKNVLQQVKVPIVPSDTCKQPNYWGTQVDDTMLCAGSRGADSCFGDGGGPLVCKRGSSETWELQGLVAWGPRECGTENKPGVYTNVNTMKSWILANIGNGGGSGGPLPPAPPASVTRMDPPQTRGRRPVFDSSEEGA